MNKNQAGYEVMKANGVEGYKEIFETLKIDKNTPKRWAEKRPELFEAVCVGLGKLNDRVRRARLECECGNVFDVRVSR